MSLKLGKKKSKQPNYLSNEFVITNHGDICSILAMIFVVGLFFKSTTPIAAKFILMQHNASETSHDGRILYYNGLCDVFAIIFYVLVQIIVHAIIQEYALDRMSMTKARLSRFNHVSQMAIFLVCSLYYIGYILYHDGLFRGLSDLWEGYPHTPLHVWTKFFFILQISYWFHNIPELYFQKVKKEDIISRITPSLFFIVGISAAYAFNLNKLCILVLLIQYSSDFTFYLARASDLALQTNIARIGFSIWNTVFIPARILIICLTFLTLQYGLSKNSKNTINFLTGDFNVRLVRLNCLLLVFFSQAWMMYVFVNYHLKKRRENASVKLKSTSNVEAHKKKEKKKTSK